MAEPDAVPQQRRSSSMCGPDSPSQTIRSGSKDTTIGSRARPWRASGFALGPPGYPRRSACPTSYSGALSHPGLLPSRSSEDSSHSTRRSTIPSLSRLSKTYGRISSERSSPSEGIDGTVGRLCLMPPGCPFRSRTAWLAPDGNHPTCGFRVLIWGTARTLVIPPHLPVGEPGRRYYGAHDLVGRSHARYGRRHRRQQRCRHHRHRRDRRHRGGLAVVVPKLETILAELRAGTCSPAAFRRSPPKFGPILASTRMAGSAAPGGHTVGPAAVNGFVLRGDRAVGPAPRDGGGAPGTGGISSGRTTSADMLARERFRCQHRPLDRRGWLAPSRPGGKPSHGRSTHPTNGSCRIASDPR